jgi:hypothetical protein
MDVRKIEGDLGKINDDAVEEDEASERTGSTMNQSIVRKTF